MSTHTKESMIEKVRALISRATHPHTNKHEAEACATKARELMEKYRLCNDDLEEQPEITEQDAKGGAKWESNLARVIADMYNLRLFYMGKDYKFIGDTLDMEMGLYVFDQLRNKFKALAKQYVKEQTEILKQSWGEYRWQYTDANYKAKVKRNIKDSFLLGCVAGVAHSHAQRAQGAKKENEPGLVRIASSIQQYVDQKYPVRGVKRWGTSHVSKSHYETGVGAGQTTQINKGVGTSPASQKLLN